MKKFIYLTAMVVLGLCSCNRLLIDDVNKVSKKRKDIVLTKAQASIVPATREFTFDLVREICATENRKNIIISPFSLQAALAMASAGASGETRDEINEAIGFEDFSQEDIYSLYETLVPALLDADNTVDIAIANSAWARKDARIRSEYSSLLKDRFKASIHELSSKSGSEVSDWVKKATKGMIKGLDVDTSDESIKLLLLNALYFKGMWSDVFDKSQNRQDVFTDYDGCKKDVTFMYKEADMGYYYSDLASSVTLSYGNGAYRMTILIPTDPETSIDEVLESLDEDMWTNMSYPVLRGKVQLQMPKFKCDYTSQLLPVLKSLGIEKAFTDAAEFQGIAELPLCINDVKQRTLIEVDEKGTEAASVTHVVFGCTSAGPGMNAFSFKVDTPFFYAISEISTGTILFAGVQKWL